MNKKAYILHENGTKVEVVPKNGIDFKLEELYELTDSKIIQMVYLASDSDNVLVCDEEGMFTGKIPNPEATKIGFANGVLMPPQGMLGKILLCHRSMIK